MFKRRFFNSKNQINDRAIFVDEKDELIGDMDELEVHQKENALHLHFAAASQKATVHLYNAQGVCLYEKGISISTKSKSLMIPTLGYVKGVYFLKVTNSKGKLLGWERVFI